MRSVAASRSLTCLKAQPRPGIPPRQGVWVFPRVSCDTRKGSVPGIGNDQKFIAQAFELTEAAKIPDQVVDGQAGLYVMELKERKAPLDQGLDIAKASIRDRILSQKQNALYSAWVKELRDNSDITISKQFLNN